MFIGSHAKSISEDPILKPLLRERSVVLAKHIFKLFNYAETRVSEKYYSELRFRTSFMMSKLLAAKCFDSNGEL